MKQFFCKNQQALNGSNLPNNFETSILRETVKIPAQLFENLHICLEEPYQLSVHNKTHKLSAQ